MAVDRRAGNRVRRGTIIAITTVSVSCGTETGPLELEARTALETEDPLTATPVAGCSVARAGGSEEARSGRHGRRKDRRELPGHRLRDDWQRRGAWLPLYLASRFVSPTADVSARPDFGGVFDPGMIPHSRARRPTNDDIRSTGSDPLSEFLKVNRVPFSRLGLLIRGANRMASALRLPVSETAQFQSLGSRGPERAAWDALLRGQGLKVEGGAAVGRNANFVIVETATRADGEIGLSALASSTTVTLQEVASILVFRNNVAVTGLAVHDIHELLREIELGRLVLPRGTDSRYSAQLESLRSCGPTGAVRIQLLSGRVGLRVTGGAAFGRGSMAQRVP